MWRSLAAPRLPSEPERRLLVALADAVNEPLLTVQIATVVVEAACRCGCSSVRLRSDERPMPAETISKTSRTGRDDYLAVEATGAAGPEQQAVNVVLHVFAGRVGELEVLDSINGEGAAVPLTDLRLTTKPMVT